eukprot:scaffold2838_cov112-Cylindrotheca_fusiformis.AAC.3
MIALTVSLGSLVVFSRMITSAGAEAITDNSNNREYMYLKMDADARYPVQEIRIEDATTKDGSVEPFFLSENYPNPRVVEFYAHWCPHCMHFKPQYIQFARTMTQVTEDLYPPMTIEIFAVSCVPFHEVCKNHNVLSYPVVQLYSAHSSTGSPIERNLLHPFTVLRRFGISVSGLQETNDPQREDGMVHVAAAAAKHKNGSPYFLYRSQQQIFQDAHLSFDFVLRNGVFVTNDALDSKRQQVLKEFLTLLQKAFPTTSSIQPLVENLIDEIDTISQSDSNLLLVLDKHPTPSSSWSPACLQHGTGYTCGLWQIFHIICIGTVEWNQMSPNPQYHLSPLKVADSIRDFVDNFFQCEECRMHFTHEYDSCGHDRCNRLIDDGPGSTIQEWKELPLWLYETHNGVNARLRRERMERHDEQEEMYPTTPSDVLWPPRDQCPSCWLSTDRWEDNAVYEYMRSRYWSGVTFRGKQGRRHVDSQTDQEAAAHPATSDHQLEADETSALRQYVPPIAILVLSSMAAVAWYRKRQYDRKGMHKKKETN